MGRNALTGAGAGCEQHQAHPRQGRRADRSARSRETGGSSSQRAPQSFIRCYPTVPSVTRDRPCSLYSQTTPSLRRQRKDPCKRPPAATGCAGLCVWGGFRGVDSQPRESCREETQQESDRVTREPNGNDCDTAARPREPRDRWRSEEEESVSELEDGG